MRPLSVLDSLGRLRAALDDMEINGDASEATFHGNVSSFLELQKIHVGPYRLIVACDREAKVRFRAEPRMSANGTYATNQHQLGRSGVEGPADGSRFRSMSIS
jgi:hypothetical protein